MLMHANTVWLLIKRQTFLAASVTQNMSVPPAQQVYCPAVKHKSGLHPGFVLLFLYFGASSMNETATSLMVSSLF